MATQKTVVEVEVTDKGSTEKLNQQAQKTHKSFKDLAKTAANIVTGKGTAGSTAAASAAAPKGSQAIMTEQAYGAARGTAGATGASARDFAKQAEGLGGIVRLYATYAANVYALGAAFTALSTAMDTSNMVKGLDQLGASTGVALGTLSKRFVEATDGAISLREAMEATVKASSSGMDSDQILRMANVAKQASQALGVDMSDAISRISRGITKLEPELLDELGLFTKTGKAAEEYARSVGKSVSQLTDFERRASFANAVLAEGEDKFGSIQLDTNPYTKLLASVRDLAQTFLDFVNKALVPAVNLLSSSPTLLGTAIAGLAGMLIKQAIPAIGEVREGFAKAAEASAEAAKRRFTDLDKINKLETAARLKELDDRAQIEAEKFHAASDRLVAEYNNRNTRMAKLGTTAKQIAEKAASEVTDKEIAWLKERSEAVDKYGAPTKRAGLYKEQYDALVKFKAEEEAYQQKAKELLEDRQKAQTSLTTAANTYRVYQRELASAQSKEIASNAAYIGSIKGMGAAWQQLNADIAVARQGPTTRTFELQELDAAGNKVTRTVTETIPQMDKLRAGMTRVAGTIGLVTGALGTLINAFSPWLAAIGIVVGLLSLLDSVASKATKSLDQFSSSTTDLAKSADTLAATLAKVNENNPYSVSSLEAQATAMRGFAESIDSVVKSAQKAQVDIASSTYDSVKNTIFSLFGGGLSKNFSKAMSDEISSVADSLKSSPVATKFNKSIESILGIKDAGNFEQLSKAIAKLDPKSEKVRELQKAIKEAGTDASIAASKAREFDNAFLSAQKSYANIIEKFKVKDELTLFAVDSATALGKLSTSLSGDITTSLDNIKTLFEGINKAPIFGVDQTEAVLKLQTRLNDTSNALSENQKSVAALRKEYSELNKVANGGRLKNLNTNNSFDVASASDEQIKRQQNFGTYKTAAENFMQSRQELETSIANAQAQAVKLRADGSKLAGELSKFVAEGLQNSIRLVATSIQAALAKAGNKALESIYSQIDFAPELAGKEYDLKLKQLDAEASLVKVNRDLVQATLLSAARMRELSAITAKQMVEKAGEEAKTAPGSASLRKFESMQEQFPNADKELDAARQALKLLGQATTSPAKALNTLQDSVAGMSDEARAMVPEVLSAVQALAGFDIQLANIADQQALIRLVEKPLSISKKQSADDIRKQTDIGRSISEEQKAIANKMQLGGATQALVLEENRLAISKLDSDEKLKQLDIQEKYNQQVILANGLKTLGQAKDADIALKAAARLKEEDEGLLKKWKSNELSSVSLATGQKLYSLEIERQSIANKLADTQERGATAEQDAALQVREIQLQSAKDSELYTEEYLNSQNYQLEVFKINEEAKRQEADLTREYNRNKDALEAELLLKGGKGTVAGAAVFAQTEAETAAYEKQSIAIGVVAKAKLQAAEASKTLTDKQLEFTKSLDWLKGLDAIFIDLGSAFDGLGTKIANTVSTFDSLNTQQKANANSLAEIEKRKKAVEESGDSVGPDLLEEEAALRKRIQKDELAGYAKTASAAKAMFKEKTAAFKVFSAIEKTSQMISLALELKTSAAKIATWWAEIPVKATTEGAKASIETTAAAAKAPITYAEIVGQYLKSIPAPFGMVAGVAAGAFFLSMLGLGGGGGSAPQVPTSAQRQETQGTAMSWQVKEGKLEKVQTRRGVFGDTDAKSESITKSLDLIRETAVEGLSYDNRVVSLLGSINEGISGSAKALYRIEGLRTGSMFGTTEGTRGGGIFSGSLGGTTSTSINDSGLIIKGTFAQLASDTNEAVLDLFEEVTKTKKSWYGKSKTSISTATKEIDEPISQFFSGVFSNARDLFVEIGATAQVTEGEINTILEGFTFDETKYSLRGLKGADLEKEVSSIVSSMLDEASLAVFSSFEQYAQFGEGMLETVIRVTDNSKKVSQALENMGVKVPTLGTGIFEVTESLVKLAGGMQDFLDQSNFFTENFLDAAAQLAPSQKSVVKTFKDLGLAVPKTRQEFAALVQGLDLADLSTHSTYQTLMDVAPAFDAVSDAAEEAAKTGLETLKSELEASITSLDSFIAGIGKLRESLLLGSQSILTPLEKYGQAKSLFETTYANLSSTDTKIATAARASFNETANSFLEASRTYFASSEQYTSDFNSVLAKLDAAESSAGIQLDNATLQLEALKSQLTILSNIDNGIAKLAGTTPLQAFAAGGYASGLALVGEYGPEVVDFATPGRVYTADQTAGMFRAPSSGNQQQAVVAELQAVRQELAQLRKDQQAQTGDLIISNYDANQKTATAVADAITGTAAETNWQVRAKPTLV